MDKKVEKILNDLYMIDGNFKKQEKELVKIIEALLLSKPDVEVDEKFVEKLRITLASRANYLKEEKASRAPMRGNLIFGGRMAYSLVAIALVLAVFASAAYYFGQEKNPSGKIVSSLSPHIDKLKDGAFGSLSFNQSGSTSGLGGDARALGKGGGGAPVNSSQKESVSMPSSEIVNYRYVYKGGDMETKERVTVYKRVKGLPYGNKIAEVLSSLNLGMVNLSKFGNTQMNSMSVTEDRDFGYDVNLDFREGAVSLYAGTKWPDPYTGCVNESCYQEKQLKESDMLKDADLIAIADKFLNDYQIDKSSYGDPVVMKNYGFYGGFAPKSGTIYVPEAIPVVYPLKINGQIVHDDAANSSGMALDVSLRYKKVYGARNIYAQKYESSDYEAEQDKAKIISAAENGGMYGNYRAMDAKETVDIELGTPKIELMMTWNYNPAKRTSDNLYIPSYVFPVIKVPEGKYFYQQNVIVPIPKEMLEKTGQTPGVAEPGLFIK